MNSLFVREISISNNIPSGNYINNLPVVNWLKSNSLEFNKPVTFIIGENGIGKSTLIEGLAVALGFNPEGGSKNFNFSTENSHSDLYEYLSVRRGLKQPRDGFFLRAESFYNVASNIDQMDRMPASAPPVIDSYGGVSLHAQSHGESFIALTENRFGGNGLYILDEPEAALSPMRIMRLMCNIDRLVKQGSQLIISTHSPILMTFPDADIYEITHEGIELVPYSQTEHFQITKQFLNNPERMHKYLFEE
ncbi:MAG: AAA family ATPase [Clostridia bacterium]|nr:AAA family ATPase [Clostridia bacterium]